MSITEIDPNPDMTMDEIDLEIAKARHGDNSGIAALEISVRAAESNGTSKLTLEDIDAHIAAACGCQLEAKSKYYAVIDANVLVTALLKRYSESGWIIHFALDGRIIPILNDHILEEYREVLSIPGFKFSQDIIRSILADLVINGLFVSTAETGEFTAGIDMKNKIFCEIVMERRTDDNRYSDHFPVKPYVVTPREMLQIIQNNNSSF